MVKFFSYFKNRILISQFFRCRKTYQKKAQKGQILLEYILLIVIVVMIAKALTYEFVHQEGALKKAWIKVSERIAEDYAGDPEPPPNP